MQSNSCLSTTLYNFMCPNDSYTIYSTGGMQTTGGVRSIGNN